MLLYQLDVSDSCTRCYCCCFVVTVLLLLLLLASLEQSACNMKISNHTAIQFDPVRHTEGDIGATPAYVYLGRVAYVANSSQRLSTTVVTTVVTTVATTVATTVNNINNNRNSHTNRNRHYQQKPTNSKKTMLHSYYDYKFKHA